MDADTHMTDVNAVEKDELDDDILQSSTADITTRRQLLENDIKVMKLEHRRLTNERMGMIERIKDNREKIENNR